MHFPTMCQVPHWNLPVLRSLLHKPASQCGIWEIRHFSHLLNTTKLRLISRNWTQVVCLGSCFSTSLPGSSVHGIFQARILEWVVISFSKGSSLTQGSNPSLLHCRQSPALQLDSLPVELPGKPLLHLSGFPCYLFQFPAPRVQFRGRVPHPAVWLQTLLASLLLQEESQRCHLHFPTKVLR